MAPRSLAARKSLGGALWPLKGQKPDNRRIMPQEEDRELQSTPAEKYEFTLCLKVTSPMTRAPARYPGNGVNPPRETDV